MSHDYVTVQWNRNKRVYDLWVWVGILLYLGLFIGIGVRVGATAGALSPMIVVIRALSTCAFLMLTLILCIGPLARLDRRFLPLLYNRRHMGVSMFIIALLHGGLAILWYHGFGVENPILSLFTSNGDYQSVANFPFQPLGAVALMMLLLMAATSHDYWNANLGAPLWKALHMGVYGAYAVLVSHIALGALQEDNTGLLPIMLLGSIGLVGGLHLTAAMKERSGDKGQPHTEWVDVGRWSDIPDNRAVVVSVGDDERVAVFRYDQHSLAAVSNVCKHQNGPLGEGKYLDGCITCPWHGFQYLPEDGTSPPPFTEKVHTYRLKLANDRVLLDPTPLAPGTARPVIRIEEAGP